MSKRPLNPNEQRAWARVAKSVRNLPTTPKAEMPPLDEMIETALDASKKRQEKPERPQFKPSVTHKPPSFATKAPVQNRRKERRVRRGQAEISATLDLHGHTQNTAHGVLVSFLTAQRMAGASCVLVITGKGKLGEGVLRRRLMQWLGTDEAKILINGYAQAHQKHGGAGAWYLFPRKTKATKAR